MARKLQFAVEVLVPDNMRIGDSTVARLLEMLIEVGYNDAVETAERGDCESNPDANKVVRMGFGKPLYISETAHLPMPPEFAAAIDEEDDDEEEDEQQ